MNYPKTKRVEKKYPWKVQISKENVPKENHDDKQKQDTARLKFSDQPQQSNEPMKINILHSHADEEYRVRDENCMNEFVIHLHINNLCGNNNEVTFCPPEISVTEGNLMDLNEDSICKILDVISNIPKDELDNMPAITIPIYIFNINNILSTGNKNKTTIKQDA